MLVTVPPFLYMLLYTIRKIPMTKATPAKTPAKKPRRSKTKILTDAPPQKMVIWCCIVGAVLALVIILAAQCSSTDTPTNATTKDICGCATAPIRSKKIFRDINSEQLAHAHANGLKRPITDLAKFEELKEELLDDNKLVYIKANKYYNIRPLTHSLPYLTPEAKELLNTIGQRFHANLKKVNMPTYKFQISSLLRTVEYQRQLTRINANATPSESAHYYATTFDIAYDKYDRRGKSVSDPQIEAILEKTLVELRQECRLMIIRERSNKCFHITVVVPQ